MDSRPRQPHRPRTLPTSEHRGVLVPVPAPRHGMEATGGKVASGAPGRSPPNRGSDRPETGGPSGAGLDLESLGLEAMTLARLAKMGVTRVAELRSRPVDTLWRRLGRHCLVDLLDRLEHHGLASPEFTDYERWRLGLVAKSDLRLEPRADTPVESLWPVLGRVLAAELGRRNFHEVRDLAPMCEDDVRQLYRLGRANLLRLRAVLGHATRSARGPDRDRLTKGIGWIDHCIGGRVSAPKAADPPGHADIRDDYEPSRDPTGSRT
ncbi:MAG: hypothetical protein WCJ69_13810 [Betaproteobacteria bacterium]